jgi:hypothetical protein
MYFFGIDDSRKNVKKCKENGILTWGYGFD